MLPLEAIVKLAQRKMVGFDEKIQRRGTVAETEEHIVAIRAVTTYLDIAGLALFAENAAQAGEMGYTEYCNLVKAAKSELEAPMPPGEGLRRQYLRGRVIVASLDAWLEVLGIPAGREYHEVVQLVEVLKNAANAGITKLVLDE